MFSSTRSRARPRWRKHCTGLFVSPSRISDPCGTVAGMVTPKRSMSTEGETLQVSVLPYRCSICWLLRAPDKRFSHTLDGLGRWPRPASSFRSAQAATLLEFHVPLTNCFVRRCFASTPSSLNSEGLLPTCTQLHDSSDVSPDSLIKHKGLYDNNRVIFLEGWGKPLISLTVRYVGWGSNQTSPECKSRTL